MFCGMSSLTNQHRLKIEQWFGTEWRKAIIWSSDVTYARGRDKKIDTQRAVIYREISGHF